MKQTIFFLTLCLILFTSLAGCRAIHVGGSGSVGGVYGGGGISIPVPKP